MIIDRMMLQTAISGLLVYLATKEHLVLCIDLRVVHLIVLLQYILAHDMLLQDIVAVFDNDARLPWHPTYCVRLTLAHVPGLSVLTPA